MSITHIQKKLAGASFMDAVRDWAKRARGANERTGLKVSGGIGSMDAFTLVELHRTYRKPMLCIVEDHDQAAYVTSDLEQVADAEDVTLLLRPTSQKPYDTEAVLDPAVQVQRSDVLQQLSDGFEGIVVASAAALAYRLPSPGEVRDETLLLQVGEEVALNDLAEQLTGQQFTRVEFVEAPGEFAVRGGIVDVYPFVGEYPLRIEFFGDEIDSIREFDRHSQRSVSRVMQARLVPNVEQQQGSGGATLFDYLPEDTLVATINRERILGLLDEHFQNAGEAYVELDIDSRETSPSPEQRYVSRPAAEAQLAKRHEVAFGRWVGGWMAETVTITARPQPNFNSRIHLLKEQLAQNEKEGLETIILCDSRGQESRLRQLLEDELDQVKLSIVVESLHEGFEVSSLALAVYTDHQIFNRYHRPTARKKKKQYGGLSPRELKNLNKGDFVVHVDYGIGRFDGLQKRKVRGQIQEVVRVQYLGGDMLYVNVNALYKLHKYTGKEGHQPRLTKLGSGQWERTKAKTKKRAKDIARDLIQLYAKRKQSRGHAFAPDSIWQQEMEASFQYEDTPDQYAAAEAVKSDMEDAIPMDRLVCGDVGFGKTEVAMRAAFKAVQDGKQVAVLVPTTILAAQHNESFKRRFEAYPVNVDVISRFRTKVEQKEVIEKVAAGEVDILIGTHRLTSKDVKFKNLGLLVVDEEQKFGVAAKEKLRKLRAEVDTLTLTATPIPRTLQFSLMGARDLSIIATAPPNRQPIVTEIHSFNRDLIRDAILYETTRGGQVFFIHNRVQTIEEISAMVRAMVPNIRIQVAHGQMKPSELERIMMGFIDHKYDVLVSTNIIESGLDISNANTIIINNAHHFGLAELHQLRGRVGRSNQKAFCYLMVPSVHTLTREARQRLQALEEFSELGSGFNIAMRDLDIRGAGNMLGAEQSGFIADIGFETYHKILDEAVQELRVEEFKEIFGDAPVPMPGECVVEVEDEALIPETYVLNTVERLNLYRRISEAEDAAALDSLREEMADRFGELPEPVSTLLDAATLRHLGERLRLPKVMFKNERLFLEAPKQGKDPYFYEHVFHPWLERLNQQKRRYVLKETDSKKLRAIVQNVPDLNTARRVLEHVQLDFDRTKNNTSV
ncbi:MAG: transcription-repair coupling factor [Rhodothermales bacterium]